MYKWAKHRFATFILRNSKNKYEIATPKRDIGPAVRVFANGPGDLGSIPGRVIPKDFKNGT